MALIVLFVVVILGDQLLKHHILANFAVGEATPFIPHVLQLTHFQNTGMAFGFLQNHQWVPLVLTPALLLALGVLLFRRVIAHPLQRLAIVGIMAGGFSNWVDRLLHGFVVDMFEPIFINFAVFNIADTFIVLGGFTWAISFFIEEQRKSKALQPPQSTESADD
ncbi:MAG: signal peptidase II [Oscillospiraceae bacterium]|nr:signal peptidase II [Oscillospiraceae bacterium]